MRRPVSTTVHRERRVGDAGVVDDETLAFARHDPVTGYACATSFARQLGDRALLLTYDGWGHGAYLRSARTQNNRRRVPDPADPSGAGTRCPAIPPSP